MQRTEHELRIHFLVNMAATEPVWLTAPVRRTISDGKNASQHHSRKKHLICLGS